jgi:hypothetical protein
LKSCFHRKDAKDAKKRLLNGKAVSSLMRARNQGFDVFHQEFSASNGTWLSLESPSPQGYFVAALGRAGMTKNPDKLSAILLCVLCVFAVDSGFPDLAPAGS